MRFNRQIGVFKIGSTSRTRHMSVHSLYIQSLLQRHDRSNVNGVKRYFTKRSITIKNSYANFNIALTKMFRQTEDFQFENSFGI